MFGTVGPLELCCSRETGPMGVLSLGQCLVEGSCLLNSTPDPLPQSLQLPTRTAQERPERRVGSLWIQRKRERLELKGRGCLLIKLESRERDESVSGYGLVMERPRVLLGTQCSLINA